MLRWFSKQFSESGSQTWSDSIAKWCGKYATLHLQHLKRQLSCMPCHRRLVHRCYAMAWDVFNQHSQQIFLDLPCKHSKDRARSSCCFGGARTWSMISMDLCKPSVGLWEICSTDCLQVRSVCPKERVSKNSVQKQGHMGKKQVMHKFALAFNICFRYVS